MMSKFLSAGAVLLALTATTVAAECEYRGGDSMTMRPTGVLEYDLGYGLDGFDDPATNDHCSAYVTADREHRISCSEGFDGAFKLAGSTIDADDDGIMIFGADVLYKVCR